MNPPVIHIDIGPEGHALIQRLAHLPQATLAAIKAGMDKAAQITVGGIQAQRLTGQGPFPVEQGKLGVVTNRLRASARATRASVVGSQVSHSLGSNVIYARVHEFGFNGQVSVPAHTRRVKSRDQYEVREAVSTKTGRKRKSKVRVASGVATVRAHTRWLQIPARAPFGHGLADHAPVYGTEIRKALAAVLGGDQK